MDSVAEANSRERFERRCARVSRRFRNWNGGLEVKIPAPSAALRAGSVAKGATRTGQPRGREVKIPVLSQTAGQGRGNRVGGMSKSPSLRLRSGQALSQTAREGRGDRTTFFISASCFILSFRLAGGGEVVGEGLAVGAAHAGDVVPSLGGLEAGIGAERNGENEVSGVGIVPQAAKESAA